MDFGKERWGKEKEGKKCQRGGRGEEGQKGGEGNREKKEEGTLLISFAPQPLNPGDATE